MSAHAPIIRDARDDERDAVRALTHAAYAEYARTMAPDAWTALERALGAALDGAPAAGAACLVAEHDGALVGSVFLFPPAATAYTGQVAPQSWPELRLLAVAPAGRGLGTGEALVRGCAARARAWGAPALGLHTSASMGAARRLYARLGFVRDPGQDFQPPGAELVEGYRLAL